MSKYERKIKLKQNKNEYIKKGSIILSVVLLVVGVIYITYSKFVSNQEYTLINGRVTSDGDVGIIAVYQGDEKTDSIPAKNSGWIFDKAECTNDATASWDNDEWGLNVRNISGKTKCTLYFFQSIATMSWSDMITAYNEGNTTLLEANMIAGATKEVDLGSLGVHPVRIANLTKCSEVETTSKTACGLVIEFADIIVERSMSPNNYNGNVNGDGNRGGWEYSDMRAYVNSTIYTNTIGSKDYSTDGVYYNIPSELKSLIIDTIVVSGAGQNDINNGITSFTTTDKLYLLSTIEVWNGFNSYDSASGEGITRQLDYYNRIGVTESNYSGTVKNYGSSASTWWLRSPHSIGSTSFNSIANGGYKCDSEPSLPLGVSPAFRLSN